MSVLGSVERMGKIETSKGWMVRRAERKNEYKIYFNGIKVGSLCDSSIHRGSLPHIIIIPYSRVEDLSVSVKNGDELRSNSCIEGGFTRFNTPPMKE